MKKFLLSLLCAFVALGANALTVVDIYKDFTTTQNISWGSDAANARISFSSTDGLVYSSTEATANNWDAQYWVANGNTFSPDNTYTLTMMIKGSVAGTIGNIKFGDWNQGVDNYGKFNIPAGEFKEVSIKVSGVPGGDGILLQTGSYVGTLCIKWIKVTHEETSDASKLCLALTDIPAGTNVWDHALQYAFDPALPAGDYTLSLDVKGDADGSMNIWGEYVEGAYYGPVISFGTEWATKTMDFSLAKDFKLLRLVFGQYTGSSLYFDNIKITNKATGEEVVSADFSTGTLEGFDVAGFWTNDGGWVEHKANYEIVEAPESEEPDEPAWTVPEGEIDYTTLDGFKDVNNIGTPLNGGEVVYGDQSNGDNFTDVTDYDLVKFYGTPGALLRVFVNRVGSDGVTEGKTEQRVTIGEDGVGILNIKDVMTATEKNYCRISGIKIAASWQGATIDAGVVIKGITVVKLPETYTISTTAGKIGTIALDYPATIEGAELYEVVSFDAKEGLAIAEVEGDMVGGTPYIYLATADEVVCTKTGDAVEHGDFNCTKSSVGNGLTGCYEEVTSNTWWFGFIKNNAYVISGGKLRQIANSDVTIPANRCFFDPANCTNQSSSAKMVLAMDGATKINNVNAALEGGKIYDMNGREVQSMKKGGIYIVGGMKVSVK